MKAICKGLLHLLTYFTFGREAKINECALSANGVFTCFPQAFILSNCLRQWLRMGWYCATWVLEQGKNGHVLRCLITCHWVADYRWLNWTSPVIKEDPDSNARLLVRICSQNVSSTRWAKVFIREHGPSTHGWLIETLLARNLLKQVLQCPLKT